MSYNVPELHTSYSSPSCASYSLSCLSYSLSSWYRLDGVLAWAALFECCVCAGYRSLTPKVSLYAR